MNLQLLRIFKAVADEGGIARAAVRLNCVQSNVSTRLMELEETLGTPLFNRIGRRLVITPKGIQLLGFAERLFQLAEEARLAIQGTGAPAGKLRIGSMVTAAASRLPAVLTDFHRRYPSVELLLETGPTDHIVERVLSHSIDVALVSAPIYQSDLVQMEIFEEELVLISGPGYDKITSSSDVQGEVLLVFPTGCVYRPRLIRWFTGENSPASVPVVEIGTAEAILGCVAAGLGIALMPRALVQEHHLEKSVRCHNLPDEYARVQILLVWRKDIAKHSARQAFTDCLIRNAQIGDEDQRIATSVEVEAQVESLEVISKIAGRARHRPHRPASR